jgi:hypothetical protein
MLVQGAGGLMARPTPGGGGGVGVPHDNGGAPTCLLGEEQIMKAVCPHCGWMVALTIFPEPGTEILCADCGRSFDPETHLMFHFGETHVSQEVESFVVEWQLRG